MTALTWTAGKDGTAHAAHPGHGRTLCGQKAQDPRWAWPELARCADCHVAHPKQAPPPRPPHLRVVGYVATGGPYSVGDRRHPQILWPGERVGLDSELVAQWPYLFAPVTEPA
jgi:hypothetical protein